MLRFIFKGIRVQNKAKFIIFTTLYILTTLIYIYLCTIEGLLSHRLIDRPFSSFIFSDLPHGALTAPIITVLYSFISIFEWLFIIWQTNFVFQKQRLTRLGLFGIFVLNLFFAIYGLTVNEELEIMLIVYSFVFLIISIPTIVITKITKYKGYYKWSDIMTEDEYYVWINKSKRKSKHK